MKTLNSVRLEGFVETCRIVGQVEGKTVAKLSVITLHPKDADPPAEVPQASLRYEKIRHMARVVAAGKTAALLGSIEERLKDGVPGESFFPCRVEGCLCSEGMENFVHVPAGGFTLVEKVPTVDNNEARITGKVASVSYTDRTAKLSVQTAQGTVSVFILKGSDIAAWNSVAEGRIAKGDAVSLSGPLLSGEYTDGSRRVCASVVTPHVLSKLELKKEKTRGQSL